MTHKWYLTQIKDGKESEERFIEQFGGAESTPTQNMVEGWDVMVDGIKIDVKGPKRIRRKDKHPNPHYHWVELKNNAGRPGWLYKQADYFAFEEDKYWIIVKRIDLIEWLKMHLISEEVDEPYPYKLYGRKNKKDQLTLVPTVHLCGIAKTMVVKV